MLKILGIDPGTKRVGFGIIKKIDSRDFDVLDFGCLETRFQKKGEILEDIFLNISKIIKKNKPELVCLEKIFFFKNQKTAFDISQARGVILLACQREKVSVTEPTPLEIKTCLTGYGRADKKQVAQMVKKLLRLEKIPKLDDTTDALACALTGFYLTKFK